MLIVSENYELPENLQEQLENAIGEVKKLPEILDHQEYFQVFQEYLKKIEDPLNYFKDYFQDFQEYLQKIKDPLNYFKDFDEKALKIDDLNQIIDLKFVILSCLATLKTTGIFLLVEKLKNNDLESISNEINLKVGEIDKNLPEWINCCTKITNKFEDLSNFISKIEDSHLFFAIQEEILTKIADKKTNLRRMSEEIKPKRFFSNSKEKKKIQKEIYSNFLQIIGLKLVYDLATELEYATNRLKFLDIQKILDTIELWKKLSDELQLSEELLKSFEKSELYAKEYYLDYLVESLTEIGCSINNFCKQIIDEKFVKDQIIQENYL